MNHLLRRMASAAELDESSPDTPLFAFGLACIDRVADLISHPDALAALQTGHDYRSGQCSADTLKSQAALVRQLARSQAGSNSLDGSGNAVVSATHALSHALNGKPLDAADYAAYARVYSYSSHSVTDPAAYQSEYEWQAQHFQALLGETVTQ